MSDPFTTVVTADPRYNLAVQEGGGLTLTLSGPAGPAGATGATGAAGPNEVTSATASDGTADLSVSNITINSDGTNLGAFDIASGMFGIQMGTGDLYATLSSSNWYGTTFTGSHIQDVGTTDTPTFGNLTLASGTITTSRPLSLTQTWNSGLAFTAFQINVTEAGAANGNSLLLSLQRDGVSRFTVDRSGTAIYGQARLSSSLFAPNVFANNNFYLGTSGSLSWKNNVIAEIGSVVLSLVKDADNTLAQRNGANAQEFRLYGTTNTAVTEYERLKLKYNSATLSYQIGTEKGGTTTSARPLEFQTDGTTRMTIGATGHVGIGITPSIHRLEIQNSSVVTQFHVAGQTSTKGAFVTGSDNGFFIGGNNYFNGSAWIASDSSVATMTAESGTIRFFTSTGHTVGGSFSPTERMRITASGLLTFGGITSSIPALKPNGAILQARLADDSGYTTIDAQHRLQGTAPASATAAGTAGDIRYDADYIYICTATNTWKRAAIATWP